MPAFPIPGFEIVNVLGRGGMGIVYKARQISLGRWVALKVLPPVFASDPTRLLRFRKEAEIAALLADSRILEIYDIIEAGEQPVIVMPCMDGPDLDKIIKFRKRARKDEEELSDTRTSRTKHSDRAYFDAIIPLLDQLVDAVAVLHEAGVIHRDIKPSNVLADLRGNVRLSDFGLARFAAKGDITRPGGELGTPGFMSPEQWEGSPQCGPEVDVFGLGATLYRALTLTLPYGRTRVSERSDVPKDPSALATFLTRDHDAVLLKALEPNPKDRYPSAFEFREDWIRLRKGLIPHARRVGPVRRAIRNARRKPGLLINAIMIVMFLGAWGLLSFLFPSPAPLAQGSSPFHVRIRTDPAGARFAAIRLAPLNREPRPDQVAQERPKPIEISLVPGNYLILAVLNDESGQFPEGLRQATGLDGSPISISGYEWVVTAEGTPQLATVRIPRSSNTPDSVEVPGTRDFTVTYDPQAPTDGRRRYVPIDPFVLQPPDLPGRHPRSRASGLPYDGNTRNPSESPLDVPADERDQRGAEHVVEPLSRRLPTGTERLDATTNQGTLRYPLLNDSESRDTALAHPRAPRPPAFHQTISLARIYGLYADLTHQTRAWAGFGWLAYRQTQPEDDAERREAGGASRELGDGYDVNGEFAGFVPEPQ